mgnify:CR=1 FL=1|jgi:hypothetical protein
MRKLYEFQSFDISFFDNLELAVVSENNKKDRKTITVIILEDHNQYKDTPRANLFEKFYVNILNENFLDYTFKEGQPFSLDMLESGYSVVQFGENWNKSISIKGYLKES